MLPEPLLPAPAGSHRPPTAETAGAGTPPRSCALCGCTEFTACKDSLRGPCWWVGERLCSHCAQPDARRSRALVAASQLSDVVAELLRFVREGDQESFEPFALDPAENTADALRAIIEIQQASPPPPWAVEQGEATVLLGALSRFLEGWV